MKHSRFVIIFCLFSVLGCVKNGTESVAKSFFLYTSLNGYGANKVILFEVNAQGNITNQKAFNTQGLGDADTTRYPPTRGDFSSQGGLLIIQDKLLVVNPGSDDISIFNINKTTGNLSFINKFASHGKRPVSLSATKASYNFITNTSIQTDNFFHVLVANQFDYPLISDTGVNKVYYPNKNYYQNLTVLESQRNVSLFLLNMLTGELQFEKTIEIYPNSDGGINQVAFNRHGTKFAISTNGIPHITNDVQFISLQDQIPSKVIVYNFSQNSNNPNPAFNKQIFSEIGISNTVSFDWSANDDFIYVVNGNITIQKNDNSLVSLQVDSILKKVQHFSVADAFGAAACWIFVDPVLQLTFVASPGANAISVFKNNAQGKLDIFNPPNGKDTYFITLPGAREDNTELFTIGDYLFTLKSFFNFTFISFKINNDGTITKIDEQRVIETPIKSDGAYNFLGLKGFQKE